jgi:hypothetical protein
VPLSQVWGNLHASGEVPVNQAPSTVSLVAGVAGQRIVVLTLTLTASAASTAKLTEVAGDLSGAFDLITGVPLDLGDGDDPVCWTTVAGEDLKLITTGGNVHGLLIYALAPDAAI